MPSGIGIGLRRAHFDALLSGDASSLIGIDWMELVPEVFLGVGGRARRVLDAMRERTRLVPHGVSLSLGGSGAIDGARLEALRALCGELDAPYYSDHVCLSSIDGVETFDLLPLPFCEEAAEHVARRAREASERLERPLVLENISYYATMPGSRWSEGEFLRAVLEQSGAGLLLDVSNVLVNARNHRIDPVRALDALPLERTVQIHLAGHRFEEAWGLWIDDHASAPSAASLALYEHALRKIGRPVPTLIEWDQRVPSLDVLRGEAARVRQAAERALAPQRVVAEHVVAEHVLAERGAPACP
ncbi:MAG: DUF692 domain-containing protein [Myxococcota bacterium]|nr:DUF692 domain-containing protein [Myxococcota bacterium]